MKPVLRPRAVRDTKGNVNNENETTECNSLTSSDTSYARIVSINVCGLASKLRNPEFVDVISKYDIICLTETKTDKADNIDIPNFSVFSKHRSNLSFRKSGGTRIQRRVECLPNVYLSTDGLDMDVGVLEDEL